MATLVCFHAHPDDEAIGTGGTIAKAASEGHRVVLVLATRGEQGEVPEGVPGHGNALGRLRESEARRSAEILGVQRLEFLGYTDSGMPGSEANLAHGSFASADVEEAATRLAALLEEEGADVVTIYEPRGVTGHPDHIQVHRVGRRAAEMAGVSRVYEGTVNRTQVLGFTALAREAGIDPPEGVDLEQLGIPDSEITTAIDVRQHLEAKRASMAAHASQIAETSVFLALPGPLFAQAWGTEWFVRRDWKGPGREDSLFDGLGAA